MRKRLLGLLGGLAMLASVPTLADEHKQLVTIGTSPNAQTQLMAMVLTMQAVKQGAAAHILLCGEAGDMAMKDAPATVTDPQKPKGMSPQALMNMIMVKTPTTVEVCTIYLPNKDVDTTALIDGITTADPAEMTGRILTDDVRIMSF